MHFRFAHLLQGETAHTVITHRCERFAMFIADLIPTVKFFGLPPTKMFNSLIHFLRFFDCFLIDATNANHRETAKRDTFGVICCREISFFSSSVRGQKILEIPYGDDCECLFKSFNTVAAAYPQTKFFCLYWRKQKIQINSVTKEFFDLRGATSSLLTWSDSVAAAESFSKENIY